MNLKKTKLITLLYLVALLAILSFSAISIFSDSQKSRNSKAEVAESNSRSGVPSAVTDEIAEIPVFSDVMKAASEYSETNSSNPASVIFFRLFIAVLLTALLAFRPKKSIPLFQRNFHVIQTQILLAVVAASLMMIVGNNAARAFAIFAAVSLVRFRTNIKNPKEVTVLLVSLAIGLAAGVGYWQLGTILCVFVMGLLWFLEHKEDENSFRSMELTVKTFNAKKTQNILKATFDKHELESELRRIDISIEQSEEQSEDRITYFLNLPLDLSTDYLTEEIMSSDIENVHDVKWDHKPKELQIYE